MSEVIVQNICGIYYDGCFRHLFELLTPNSRYGKLLITSMNYELLATLNFLSGNSEDIKLEYTAIKVQLCAEISPHPVTSFIIKIINTIS